MASPFSSASQSSHKAAAYRPHLPTSSAPPGTFSSGTKVQVGGHRVVVEKYLSEGGFAHVYVVHVPRPDEDGKSDVAVLKRVAVPDKDALANMRTEVETMKKLKGHKHIVTYIDSHASQLKGGGYEVFLLMEFCAGGGLIDFMNTRLQHRLTEPEILKIFSDVSEGVACMHYLKPPLLHRDLKVENVLISDSGSSRTYKLCDFGSTAPPRPAARTAAEGRLIEDDVQRHTTMQYRSPEMVDVYRHLPIDEKSDIWALGVLLYKLCYYTTPFEEQGQMAILNATFKYPAYPQFSERTKKLIALMLRENPKHRPNIYQVISEVCSMRGTNVPIKDIYSHRTESESRRNEKLPSPPPVSSPPIVGISKAQPVQNVTVIPDITPMRRGRPTAPSQSQHQAPKPSPSPRRGPASDPFAALDSDSQPVRAAAADELAARFPSLDEFSLLHDKGGKFQFNPTSPVEPKQGNLTKRLTEVLADDAFARPTSPVKEPKSTAQDSNVTPIPETAGSTNESKPADSSLDRVRQRQSQIYQPVPQKPGMVSTGTMTSRSPSPIGPRLSETKSKPIWKVPHWDVSGHHRAFSQPRALDIHHSSAPNIRQEPGSLQRPGLLESNRSKSQMNTLSIPKSPASSRPSLEGQRPVLLDYSDSIGRSKSANAQRRPTSVHVESNLDYLRERELSRSQNPPLDMKKASPRLPNDFEQEPEDKNISSNVEFLRAMESDESFKKKDRRRSSSGGKHGKRASLSSISLSNTKNIFAGKFGDAFRRFESNGNKDNTDPEELPSKEFTADRTGPPLTPIAGSEATGGRSDDGIPLDESEELAPELRRELERQRLADEERRVTEAAAEYRRRVQEQGGGCRGGQTGIPNFSRAPAIQNRVQTLLSDTQRAPAQRTAEGYGKYTKPVSPQEQRMPRPVVARKPIASPIASPTEGIDTRGRRIEKSISMPLPPASAPPVIQRAGRPNPPAKPKSLRTGGVYEASSPTAAGFGQKEAEKKMTDSEEWEANFSKRYPSLSGLEMVETDIGTAQPVGFRTRDV